MEYREAGIKQQRSEKRNCDAKYRFIFELFECTLQTVLSDYDRLRYSPILQK